MNNKFRKYWENDYLQTWFEEQSFNETIFPFLKKHLKKAAKKILASRIDIIGFSVNQSNMMATLEVIQLIKKKNNSKKIILGGQVCQFPQMRKIIFDYINYKDWTNMIDVYVIGEGEETLFEIVEAIKNGVDPAKILGTEIYKTWTQIENPKRSLIKDLDSLPFPTYEEFDLSSYKSDKLPILMSRGCTGKCVFCNDHVITGTYRYRSAEHVIRELRFHYDKGIKRFSCSDLLINGNLKELEKLCDLIIKENLDITFVGQAIVRPDMDDRLLAKMHKAGFHSLVFGVESLCDKTLKNMNKHFQLKDIEDLFPRLKKA